MHGPSRMTIVETGGGRIRVLLALVIGPSTTHPFRDGALFLLVIDTFSVWAPIAFSHLLHGKYVLILSPSCFAVCGQHLFPRIAIVFSWEGRVSKVLQVERDQWHYRYKYEDTDA